MFSTRSANLVAWWVIAIVVVGTQVACLAWRPRLASFGDVVARLNSRAPSRWLLRAAWVWFGWHVFVRGAY